MNTPLTRMNGNENATFDDVREDLEALKSDVAALKCDAVGAISGVVSNVASTGADQAKVVAEQAKTAHVKACDVVASRPMTSLLVAAGVGAIASRLVARK